MEWLKAKDFPDVMTNTVRNMDLALSEMEKVVSEFTSTPLSEAQSTMSPLDRAKQDTAAVYAITSLFWAYMKAKGVDPKENGLPKELQRVKNAIGRAKQISDKALAPKLDVPAVKRFVTSGLGGVKPDGRDVANQEKNAISNDKIVPPAPKRIKLDADGVGKET